MIKPGHSPVFALRAIGQLSIYGSGVVFGYLTVFPLMAFVFCTVSMLALEIKLARVFGFSPRSGSSSLGLANSIWFRLFGTLFGSTFAILFLLWSLGTKGWASAVLAVLAAVFAYAAIGINLPDVIAKKAKSA